jgi:hypothetical protein
MGDKKQGVCRAALAQEGNGTQRALVLRRVVSRGSVFVEEEGVGGGRKKNQKDGFAPQALP